MGAASIASTSTSQWLFPVSALHQTPSRMTSDISLERELYDRSRGVEFLYRLGVSLHLPAAAMYTAATWFHRFYMRYSMEDYHRQEVAGSCIFLATKTEECGRKLRDVAKVFCSKVSNAKVEISQIPDDSKEVEECQTSILLTEEVLLEGLCFEFVVHSPQAHITDLYMAHPVDYQIQECSWSIANDSFRTPLCVLYEPRVIAAACHILAEQIVDGPHASPLDVRLSSPAASSSLPTPPSHKASPNSRPGHPIDFFEFTEPELVNVADALSLLLEYYGAQERQGSSEWLATVASMPPPKGATPREKLYKPFAQVAVQPTQRLAAPLTPEQGTSPRRGPAPTASSPEKLASGSRKPAA